LFGDVDSNTFDTNVAVLPVSLSAIGVTKANASKVKYRVSTWNEYYTDKDGNEAPVDTTDWIAYNPVSPAVNIQQSATTVADLDGAQLSVKTTEPGHELLLLHHHNANGKKGSFVKLK
jgi:hypothetical protein